MSSLKKSEGVCPSMAFRPKPLTQLQSVPRDSVTAFLSKRFGFTSSESEQALTYLKGNGNYAKAVGSSSLYIKGYGFGKREILLMCKYFGEDTTDLANWQNVAELKDYMPTLEHAVLAYRSGLTVEHVKNNGNELTLEQLRTMANLKSL